METVDYFRIWLKDKFDRKIIKQVKLSEAVGIDCNQISDYVGGRRNFSEPRKQKIADFFKISYMDAQIEGRRIAEGRPPAQKGESKKGDNGMLIDFPGASIQSKELFEKLIRLQKLSPAEFNRIIGRIEAALDILGGDLAIDKESD